MLLLLGLQFLLQLLHLLVQSGEGFWVGHGGAVSSVSGSPDVGHRVDGRTHPNIKNHAISR